MAAHFPEESVGAQRGAGGGPPASQAAEAEEGARPGAQRGRSPEPWGLDQGGGSGGAGQGRARQPDASRGSSSPRPSSRDRVPEGGFGQIKGRTAWTWSSDSLGKSFQHPKLTRSRLESREDSWTSRGGDQGLGRRRKGNPPGPQRSRASQTRAPLSLSAVRPKLEGGLGTCSGGIAATGRCVLVVPGARTLCPGRLVCWPPEDLSVQSPREGLSVDEVTGARWS